MKTVVNGGSKPETLVVFMPHDSNLQLYDYDMEMKPLYPTHHSHIKSPLDPRHHSYEIFSFFSTSSTYFIN